MMDHNVYTMLRIAHVHVAGHDYNVYISMCLTTHNMHIFKYNDHACDYSIFDNEADACLFIEAPLD